MSNKVYEFKIDNKQIRVLLSLTAKEILFEFEQGIFCPLGTYHMSDSFTWLDEDLMEFLKSNDYNFDDVIEYCELRSEWGGVNIDLSNASYFIKLDEGEL